MTAHWESDPLPLDGLALRAQGQALAWSVSQAYFDQAMAWIARQPLGTRFSSDDMVACVGVPRDDTGARSNNCVGAAISAAVKAELIRHVDWVPPRNARSHGNHLRLWERI